MRRAIKTLAANTRRCSSIARAAAEILHFVKGESDYPRGLWIADIAEHSRCAQKCTFEARRDTRETTRRTRAGGSPVWENRNVAHLSAVFTASFSQEMLSQRIIYILK